MVVEHDVGLAVTADDCVQPKLLHEEDLVGKVLSSSCSCENGGREGGGKERGREGERKGRGGREGERGGGREGERGREGGRERGKIGERGREGGEREG